MVCGTPRSGTEAPGRKARRSGMRLSRVAIQAPWRSAKPIASAMRARAGMDSTASRLVERTRSVKRRAWARRRMATV